MTPRAARRALLAARGASGDGSPRRTAPSRPAPSRPAPRSPRARFGAAALAALALAALALAALAACSEPGADGRAPDAPNALEAPQAPEAIEALPPDARLARLQELGEVAYKDNCAACHLASGKGQPPAFPPLRGQTSHMGDCANHARIALHGLSGPLTVDGVDYRGTMPSHAHLDDLTLAAILTHERTAWGNDAGPCLPSQIAAQR